MTKKEIRGLDDDDLLGSFKAANNLEQIKMLKNELLRRLKEGAENKKKLEKILALAKKIDPREHPLS
jgi:hypothetical protein